MSMREDALAIWRAAVEAADPFVCVRDFLLREPPPSVTSMTS